MRLRGIVSLGIASLLFGPAPIAEGRNPNDPYYPYQEALYLSPVSSAEGTVANAWDLSTDASSVIVAVIDTGVDFDHPDLKGNFWMNGGEIADNGMDDDGNGYIDDINGYDFRNDDSIPEDEWGHGTLSAGIIGAIGDNGTGSAGVAWSVQLMILKVFGASGGGRVSDFTDAVRYAVRNGARIINAGWTVPEAFPGDQRPLLKSAIEEAREEGVLVIAAAGNDAVSLDDSPLFPASYRFSNIIAVAALQQGDGNLLPVSNYGLETVSIAMAGEEVLAPYTEGRYATLTGTSSATALVTGVGALMLQENPALSPEDIRGIMISTSDFPEPLVDCLCSEGGSLNPHASLSEAIASLTTSSEGGVAGQEEEAGEEGGDPISVRDVVAGGCSLVLTQ